MKRLKPAVLCSIALLLLTACSKKQTLVILVPDSPGEVGSLEVKSEGGSQVLDKPYHATRITGAARAPSRPEPVEQKFVTSLFKEALDTLPQKPVHFTLYFHTDSTRLRKGSEALLPEILAAIKERSSHDISVTGHTDRIAPEDYNMELSLKRALFIHDFLVSYKISPDFLEIRYHGESNPVIKTADEVAEPLNRRVEVTVR